MGRPTLEEQMAAIRQRRREAEERYRERHPRPPRRSGAAAPAPTVSAPPALSPAPKATRQVGLFEAQS